MTVNVDNLHVVDSSVDTHVPNRRFLLRCSLGLFERFSLSVVVVVVVVVFTQYPFC